MRVFLVTLGSRGDFELFLFLGQELHARGHRVLIGSSPFYAPFLHASGLEWTPVGNGTQAEMLAVLQAMKNIPDRTLRIWEFSSNWLLPQFEMSRAHVQAMAEQADYYINNLGMAAQRGNEEIPGAKVKYEPERFIADGQKPTQRILNLVALNKALVDPEDRADKKFRFTGYWQARQPTVREPAAELAAFLQGGPPPVVITLGSMVMFDPQEVAEDISDALELAGQRGVIVGGWSEVSQAPQWSESVLCVPEAPYDWLFPRASCVIHHGGTGTVGAVLRAGKVSVVLPQLKCQEVQSWMLGRNGLSTGSFEITNLYPPELADAIHRAVTDEQCQQQARSWRNIVAQDPGVRGAADSIEEHWRTLGAR